MKLETLPRAPAQPTVRKNRWRKPVIGAVVLALAGGGYMYTQSQGKPAKAAEAGPVAKKD